MIIDKEFKLQEQVTSPITTILEKDPYSQGYSMFSEQNEPLQLPVVKQTYSNIPPLIVKRNDFGLLDRVNYVFNEDGSINWRKMVKPEHLAFNPQYKEIVEKQAGKPISEIPLNTLDDKYLFILLAGIKELAALRGFKFIKYHLIPTRDTFVAARCTIKWMGNYETQNQEIEFEDGADASVNNTKGFGTQFLTATAINRAFVRTVRNFLKIHIVAEEEMITTKNELEVKTEEPKSPTDLLQAAMTEKGISFDDLKALAGKGFKWDSVEKIPKGKVFTYLGLINQNKK